MRPSSRQGFLLFALSIFMLSGFTANSARLEKGDDGHQTVTDTLTASRLFTGLDACVLDLLSPSNRQDMLDWYSTDSIAPVINTMEGESWMVRPLTRDYIKVHLTPVSTLTARVLKPSGRNALAVTVYTIGDSVTAADSDVRFYDAGLKELPREKYIKPVSTIDFLDVKRLSHDEKKQLQAIVPFPTVEYRLNPDNDLMEARLTLSTMLGEEQKSKLAPYLIEKRTYRWNGKKYELEKL